MVDRSAGFSEAPRVNRLELRAESSERHRLVPIVRAFLQPLDERFGLRTCRGSVLVKNRSSLGSLKVA